MLVILVLILLSLNVDSSCGLCGYYCFSSNVKQEHILDVNFKRDTFECLIYVMKIINLIFDRNISTIQ